MLKKLLIAIFMVVAMFCFVELVFFSIIHWMGLQLGEKPPFTLPVLNFITVVGMFLSMYLIVIIDKYIYSPPPPQQTQERPKPTIIMPGTL